MPTVKAQLKDQGPIEGAAFVIAAWAIYSLGLDENGKSLNIKDAMADVLHKKAIEAKVKAEQDAAQMEFVLQKEQQEAKRKSIEAGGIADFQRIVSDGISPNLLKWKGIEATEKFADSKNAKIIIMGNDANGLPVILNSGGDDSTPS